MMVRKVDELGRIVLPVEFRKALNIGTGSDINLDMKNGSIILTPHECVCSICKTAIPVGTRFNLCENCIAEIKKEV
jgi:transcriptional pleiotropic regulator of transition state genes